MMIKQIEEHQHHKILYQMENLFLDLSLLEISPTLINYFHLIVYSNSIHHKNWNIIVLFNQKFEKYKGTCREAPFITSMGSITFPKDLLIFLPFPSLITE